MSIIQEVDLEKVASNTFVRFRRNVSIALYIACCAFVVLSMGKANQWCGSRNSDFIVDITVHIALQLPCITSPVQLVLPTSWYPVWQEQEYDPILLWQLWLQR